MRTKFLIYALFAALTVSTPVALGGAHAAESNRLEQRKLQAGDRERSYLLFLPRKYTPTKPLPLVLVFHGGGGNAKGMARLSRMHELGDRQNFIVVYPNGIEKTWNTGGSPPIGAAAKQGIDDIGFIRSLIDRLKSDFTIDPRRIYATGMSMGAMFSYNLACRMPETFAAIAAVAGPMTAAQCKPPGRVSVLHIHGTVDENVPLEGGRGRLTSRGIVWPPVARGIEFWRASNGCQKEREMVFKGAQTMCWAYSGCTQNRAVQQCLVQNNGHAWPGQKPLLWQKLLRVPVNQTFSASQRIWEFFAAHPK